MSRSGYDIVYGGPFYAPTCHIAPHHCREWDENGNGCYGTNPDHGYTWEQAKAELVTWHKQQAEEWETMTEDKYFGLPDNGRASNE